MTKQCWQLHVPTMNVSICLGGGGPVDGFSATTAGDSYYEAKGKIALEAVGDMYLQTTGALGAVATSGITMGSPNTIRSQAGGDVALYAGSGMSPNLGPSGAPGAPPQPPGPANVTAGETAASRNKLSDRARSVGDIAGGVYDLATGSGVARAKGAWDAMKGGWDLTKSFNPALKESRAGKIVDGAASVVDIAFGIGGGSDGLEQVMGGLQGVVAAGPKLADGTAAVLGTSTAGSAGSGPGGAGGGGKIIQIAPSDIERKTGANMTARVAGDHKNAVDGSVEYLAGSKITLKAANKVETSSTFFEAHAHVKATMKGLGLAKVESFGLAALEGKARFTVKCGGLGKIKAGAAVIKAKAAMDVEAAGVATLKAALVWIDGPTHVTKNVNIDGSVEVVKNVHVKSQLIVDSGMKSKENFFADADVKCAGTVSAGSAKLG